MGLSFFRFRVVWPRFPGVSGKCRLGQRARACQPLAQTDDAGEGVQDPESSGRRPRDQETAIVRPEIERGVDDGMRGRTRQGQRCG